MIVDCHVHMAATGILPASFFHSWGDNISRSLPPAARSGLLRLFQQMNHDPECSTLIAEMDAAGIDKSVLLLIDFGLAFPDETLPIDVLYERHRQIAQQYPDRFVLFAGIDPRRGAPGLELFERALRDWNFRGLKLYPPCGFSPGDRTLFPYYDLCRQYEVPVLTHVGPTAPCLSFKYTRPEDVDDAAHAFPGVNFILGHAAMVWSEEAGLLAEYRPNIYLEMSGFQTELRRRSFKDVLARHKQRGRLHKILFGTDWPIHRLFGKQQDWIRELARTVEDGVLTDGELAKIFSGNAIEVLRLPASAGSTKAAAAPEVR